MKDSIEREAKRKAKEIKDPPKCRECGSRLKYVYWLACEGEEEEVNVAEDEYGDIYYYCPKCKKLLFEDKEKAVDFVE